MKTYKSILESGKVFIVAELSANHGNSIEIAKETIKAARRAGADAIKLQTYTPDTITIDSKNDDFLIKGTIWQGKTLYDLYKEAYTPWEWHKELFETAKENDLICFSTPFDKTAVDFLETLDNPIYKIASFEINDIPLIKYVAQKNKPIIISTGVGDEEDIKLAIETCRNEGNNDIMLLKTSSQYPAKIEDANMLMMPDFEKRFGVKFGLSDHTSDELVPIIATTLGAKVIEKHFILNKSIIGPDSSFSLDELEFRRMVDAVRNVEKALGKIDYQLSEKAKQSKVFSRSLYPVVDIRKGEIISEEKIKSIRPGLSLHTKYFFDILGKKAKFDIKKGQRISLDLFE